MKPNERLPESFVTQDWSKVVSSPARCVEFASLDEPCKAYLVELSGDGAPEVVLGFMENMKAYQMSADGVWRVIGHFDTYQCGVDVRGFLDAGGFQALPAKHKEIEMGGKRLRLQGCAE
jgi:hypothetical protein